MAQSFTFSETTLRRLQAHAVPLVDTIETVVSRALDALEIVEAAAPDHGKAEARVFNPASPPNLAHTKVLSVELCGHRFPPAESYWNSVLIAAIREAGKRLGNAEQVKNLVIVNCALGKKEDSGYKYLSDVGLSVQGQDANAAWRATYHIARKLGLWASVTFVWYENEKAAFPGMTGRLVIAPQSAAKPTVKGRPIDIERVTAIVERSAARPVLDSRSFEEIIGYDEFGIPR